VADEVEVLIPKLRYDITMPLVEGRVPIDGVKLVPSSSAPNGTVMNADGPLASGDFGLVDLNMGNLLPAIEAGWELIALPVFSKRKPVLTFVFCRADAGIRSPQDLEGKRVYSTIAGSAIGMWLKGLLQHRYGVDIDSITWVVSRTSWPVYREWNVQPLEGRKGVVEVLVDGDADAVMVDISDRAAFETLENDARFNRLFPNYVEEDRRLYDETGIFTPVHIIAMSKKLDRAHPDLGAKLFAAFEKSKALAYDDVLNDRAGFSVVYLRERLLEQQREWGDPFVHGITPNKNTIDTFFSYNYEQGIVKGRYEYEQVFARSTLDT
jgi:4,5-dihydroxyphthalate decarboxylase